MSKAEIMRHNGVQLLLTFLSEGLEALQYPLHCDVRSYLLPQLELATNDSQGLCVLVIQTSWPLSFQTALTTCDNIGVLNPFRKGK